jgi:hypothetical protein
MTLTEILFRFSSFLSSSRICHLWKCPSLFRYLHKLYAQSVCESYHEFYIGGTSRQRSYTLQICWSCEIWGCHSWVAEDSSRPRCYTISVARINGNNLPFDKAQRPRKHDSLLLTFYLNGVDYRSVSLLSMFH